MRLNPLAVLRPQAAPAEHIFVFFVCFSQHFALGRILVVNFTAQPLRGLTLTAKEVMIAMQRILEPLLVIIKFLLEKLFTRWK